MPEQGECFNCTQRGSNIEFRNKATAAPLIAIMLVFLLIAMSSCTKKDKCYVCTQEMYSPVTNQPYISGKTVDFCGTPKELKQTESDYKNRRIILHCN